VIETTPERESWLEDRKTAIGASDAPPALGISPWKSKFALWSEKCGLTEGDDLSESEPAEFGIRLERPIAEAFADRTGRTVNLWQPHNFIRDPERHWLGCTPDAVQESDRGEGGVQIKTASAYKASEWADGPPLIYQVQVQTEMHVAGWDWCSLVVLIGGQKLRWFDIERNDRFINEALLPKLQEFWDSVLTRTPPEVDSSLATAKILAKLHPDDNGEVLVLPDDADDWAAKLAEAKAAKKAAEEIESLYSNKLRAAIADATYGVTMGGTCFSWKTQEASYKAQEARIVKSRVLRTHKSLPKT
jgi:putative phage-type endonuclease